MDKRAIAIGSYAIFIACMAFLLVRADDTTDRIVFGIGVLAGAASMALAFRRVRR